MSPDGNVWSEVATLAVTGTVGAVANITTTAKGNMARLRQKAAAIGDSLSAWISN
jgi:hypothetical protein